jgi:hypothetical protein
MMAKMVPEIKGWFKGKGHWYPVMDRASQHTSGASQTKLGQLGVTLRKGFPQSWDLNIIENIWGVVTGKMLGKHASSTGGYRKCINTSWDEVEQATIDKLVAQLHSRMEQILEADGDWIMQKGSKPGPSVVVVQA